MFVSRSFVEEGFVLKCGVCDLEVGGINALYVVFKMFKKQTFRKDLIKRQEKVSRGFSRAYFTVLTAKTFRQIASMKALVLPLLHFSASKLYLFFFTR